MADLDNADKLQIDNVTYEDDPLGFCKLIYEESADRVDQLHEDNVENYEFYEGFDKRLEERRLNKRVVRSGIFVHELTPAIDTRKGDVIAKLEERKCPVTTRSPLADDENVSKNVAASIEERLNLQMRETGYLVDVFGEQMLAAEIYRTPSAVKVHWIEEPQMIPTVETPTKFQEGLAFLMGRPLPQSRVRWTEQIVGRPYVEWLQPDEFLYEPGVSLFQKDSQYVGHRLWLEPWDIIARAEQFGWDVDKVNEYFENVEGDEDDATQNDAVIDEVEADRGTPQRETQRENKFLLIEWYVVTDMNDGSQGVDQVVVLGNQEIISQGPAPYIPPPGLRFPFVIAVANRRLGSVENMSSVEKGKSMQRLYNESFNSYLDGLTYRIFPPFKAPKGMKFAEKPIYGPARIWYPDEPDALKPVIENPGQLPDLPGLMNAIAAKIRDTLNAQDLSQGSNAQPYEKATASKLRTMGAARRATPTHKQYGEVIIEVAKWYVALNQQFADDAPTWVLPGLVLDVPSLTNVSDPTAEKQDAMLLYSSMSQDQLFQSPSGMRKRRNAWEDVVRQFKKTDIEKYTISPEELEHDINVQTGMAQANIDKQSAAEQLQVETQGAPQQGDT